MKTIDQPIFLAYHSALQSFKQSNSAFDSSQAECETIAFALLAWFH